MNKAKFHVFFCHGCKRNFPHCPGAGLYCSAKCAKAAEAERLAKGGKN